MKALTSSLENQMTDDQRRKKKRKKKKKKRGRTTSFTSPNLHLQTAEKGKQRESHTRTCAHKHKKQTKILQATSPFGKKIRVNCVYTGLGKTDKFKQNSNEPQDDK